MTQKLKKLSPFLAPAFFCGALIFLIYALKGIWPFGTGNITYDDMAQGALPVYYHLYDWMHADKALFFDWYTGLGTNIITSGTVTPIDFIICFFKREDLLYALNILVTVKLMAASGIAGCCFDKMFPKVNTCWKTLFAVLYAMSAFSLRYYTNAFWLDFVVLFPLVAYGLKRLLDDDKPALYTVSFCAALILSVYQGFMITLAVFLIGGLYILFMLPKEDRAQRTFRLGIATLTGGLLSCWHALPMAFQTLSSKRLETSFEDASQANPILEILKENSSYELPAKLTLLLGMQIAFAFAILLLIKLFKQCKFKKAFFVLIGCTVFIAPVFFENINLIWHGGSYVQFPMRFFFISVFFFMCIGLYGLEECAESFAKQKTAAMKAVALFPTFVFTTAFLYFVYLFAFQLPIKPELEEEANNIAKTAALLISGIILFAVIRFNEKYFVRSISTILCALQILSIGYIYMPDMKEKETEKFFYNNEDFVSYNNEVSALDTDCGELGRIKNSDTSLNTNYPFLLKTPAISNWTHTIPKYTQDAIAVLGYSTQYTRIMDSGGTALTDGMLGVKKLVNRSKHPVPDQYGLIVQTENFSLYENKYALEFGLLGGEELLQSITDSPLDQRFDVQNKLWQIFSGTDEMLFDICTRENNGEKTQLVFSENDKLIFTYTAAQHEILYLNAGAYEKKSFKISVNGNTIAAPYNKQTDYIYYPSASVNGFLTLGSFNEGEKAEIIIETINGESFDDSPVQIGSLPIEKLTQLNELYKDTVENEKTGKTSLSFDYSTGMSKYLFIPISYDKGWSCKINGENAEIHQALGAYMAIELPEGEGTAELKWQPSGFTEGILLSVVGLLAAAVMLLMKKRNISIPKPLAKTVFILFAALVAAALLFLYAVPAGYTVYDLVREELAAAQTQGMPAPEDIPILK